MITCPVCSCSFTDKNLIACPQCKADFKIHNVLNRLEHSVKNSFLKSRESREHLQSEVYTNKMHDDPFFQSLLSQLALQQKNLMILIFTQCLSILILCISTFAIWKKTEGFHQQLDYKLTQEQVRDSSALNLTLTLTNALQKTLHLLEEERTERLSISKKLQEIQTIPLSLNQEKVLDPTP